jgi:hypothetical protein
MVSVRESPVWVSPRKSHDEHIISGIPQIAAWPKVSRADICVQCRSETLDRRIHRNSSVATNSSTKFPIRASPMKRSVSVRLMESAHD